MYIIGNNGVVLQLTVVAVVKELTLCCSAGPPKLQLFHPAYHHIIGQQFMLECLAVNDPDSPNNITFDWFKDDEELSKNDSNIEIEISLLNSNLFIKQLDPKDHTGVYSCGAYNNDTSNSVFTNTTLTIESESLSHQDIC